MSGETILRQAWGLYKQGRFSSALETLEPRVFQHRDDPAYYRVMGLCCLRLGDWKGGETYLQRARQLEEAPHRDTLLGLMAVCARRQDYGEAVRLGLEILDRDPRDKTAKKGLSRLRSALAAPEGGPGLDKETLGHLLPSYRKANPALRTWGMRFALGVAVVGGLAAGTWWGLSLVQKGGGAATHREGPEFLAFPTSGETIQLGAGFALTLTAEEVRQGWSRAQKAFQAYEDSRARYEINRLLLSNASTSVKERARGLIPFLHEPDFSRPEDSVPFQEVRTSPPLYEGCTVRWTGVLANLVSGDKKITFDLLLGYEDGQVVEGIVPVELGFAALLKNSQVVEVLGRIVLRDGQWYVQGTSLRERGFRTP